MTANSHPHDDDQYEDLAEESADFDHETEIGTPQDTAVEADSRPEPDDGEADIDFDPVMAFTGSGAADDFIDPASLRGFGDGDLDIDAALAAVGSLGDEMAERRAAEEAETARKDAIQQAELEYARWVESYQFDRPPMSRLKPGHPASVIPALLLMATGAYLTFALTLSETPLPSGLVVLLVSGVIGVTLLANWLATGRWARGSLFAGLSLIAFGGTVYLLSQPNTFAGPEGWPLLVVGLGAAAILTALLARPRIGLLVPVGLALMLGGGLILAVNLNLLPVALPDLTAIWPFVLGAILVLMLLPGLFRRRA